MKKFELQNMRNNKFSYLIGRGCTLGTIKNVSLVKLKNPEGICFQMVDENNKKIDFMLDCDFYSDIYEVVLTMTLAKYGLLPNGMWVHNLDVDEVMKHLRDRCTSFERINF